MLQIFPKVRNTEAEPDLKTDSMSWTFPKVRNTEAVPDLGTHPMPQIFPKVRNTEADPDLRADLMSLISGQRLCPVQCRYPKCR